jgi:hypothetical protein
MPYRAFIVPLGAALLHLSADRRRERLLGGARSEADHHRFVVTVPQGVSQ